MSRNYNENKNYNQYNKNNNRKYHNHYQNKEQNTESSYNILIELKDYMFDSKNLMQFTKHTINPFIETFNKTEKEREVVKEIKVTKENRVKREKTEIIRCFENNYKPQQKDSLFWCFFILKHGLSKYEMEIGNQHFIVEKQEKFLYIDLLRQNKELIKMHKIKPLSGLEDDLANKDRISIKTFLALCILENINILLVDNHKIYELILNDDPKINVVHRNSITYEHYIELEASNENIIKYRETYFKVSGFDATLKSMASYKVDELIDLCNKLGIKESEIFKDGKKKSKKDLYELVAMNF